MEFARVTKAVDQPIAIVWAMVAAFGALKPWIAGVESCALEGSGVGAVRSVAIGDHVTHERLIAIDPAQHRISYALIEPHVLPAKDIQATIALRALGPSQSAFSWVAEAAEISGSIDDLRARIESFYTASIERLARLLAQQPGF